MIGNCELCGREMELDEHHLIPRTNHNNKWFQKRYTKEELNKVIMVCKHDCHPAIHKFISEKELGRKYNTIELLLTNEKLLNFVNWVKKQSGRTSKTKI